MNKITLSLVFICFSYICGEAAASTPYVESTTPIDLIEDVNRQAEAWGTCSATWTILASLADEGSAQSKLNSQMANGAKLALAMAYLTDLPGDSKIGRLRATWIFTKTAMESITETQLTRMMADLEQRDSDTWVEDLRATKKVCEANLDAQQMYIDLWRKLATSGLLELE